MVDAENLNWQCNKCQKSIKKSSPEPSTPTKNITSRSKKRIALSSPPLETSHPVTRDDLRDVVTEVLKLERAEMLAELRETITTLISSELESFKKDVQDVKEKIKGVQHSIQFLSNDYDDITKKLKSSSEAVSTLSAQNECLKDTISDLSMRINQMEQYARSSNVEIQCVPEFKTENLVTLTKQLGSTIGYKIQEEQILNCTRVAKLNRDSDRPKSIIVQFNSPRTRDNFLAAAITFNKTHCDDKLNSSHIGIAGEKKPIFVLEHLSTSNKALHAAARKKSKELGYKFVWVRGGRILMRKDVNHDHIVIKNTAALNKLQ